MKFGVQFGLWGGSIHQLGTRRHHELYLRRIGSLDLPGCFAMTETGHGSVEQCKPEGDLAPRQPAASHQVG